MFTRETAFDFQELSRYVHRRTTSKRTYRTHVAIPPFAIMSDSARIPWFFPNLFEKVKEGSRKEACRIPRGNDGAANDDVLKLSAILLRKRKTRARATKTSSEAQAFRVTHPFFSPT